MAMLTRLNDEKRPDEILDAMTQTATSRRGLLAGGLTMALGAAAGMASAQNGMAPNRSGSRPPGSGGNGNAFESGGASGGASFNRSWANSKKKLLRKISYGPTTTDVAEIDNLGYSNYLEQQLNFSAIDDSACEALVSGHCRYIHLSVAELNAIQNPEWYPGPDAMDAMAIRSAHSKRQLYQRCVEFWWDHFWIAAVKDSSFAEFQRSVIWPNAMGTFRDLLVASANHGAMMIYLDNHQSFHTQTNINYARELLELHTVGVNGGYVEADIYQVAEIMTGWGVHENLPLGRYDPNAEVFKFHPARKSPGSYTVMGQTFTSTGKQQGDDLLDWLAAHPATMRHITDKLCEWFLGRKASSAILQQVSQVWGNHGDLKAVLRVILAETNVASSLPSFKRPFHMMAGLMRECNAMPITWGKFNHLLKLNGSDTSKFPQPDGLPNGFHAWSGGMIKRFHYLTRATRGFSDFDIDPVKQALQALPNDGAKVKYINDHFFLGELPVSDQVFIRRYMKQGNRDMQTLAIALCSPTYQWF
ncbi:hypothetical protein C0431_07195 [bacterium]|nr:hypothetical protein [bacterium]